METRDWRAPAQAPAAGRHTGKRARKQWLPRKLQLMKKRKVHKGGGPLLSSFPATQWLLTIREVYLTRHPDPACENVDARLPDIH